jgi:hypothetical protein
VQLWAVFALFLFRVAAQPLALVAPARSLPDFEAWHSAAIPYPALLATQIAILAVLGWTAWRFSRGRLTPHRTTGHVAIAIGALYFSVMVLRLLLGLTMLADVRWFASPLPTVFHLVLAWGVIAYGLAHSRAGARPPSGR